MNIERIPGIIFPGRGPQTAALLEGDTHAGKWIKEVGRLDHDFHTLERICGLRGASGVIWDLGAYVGDHTAAYACAAREVVAFEAQPDAARCLRENMRHYDNVTILELIIGDGSRAGLDARDELNAGARRVLQDDRVGAQSTRLDELFIHKPTLIKMDVEGWELKALLGAENVVDTAQPTLVMEVNRGAMSAVHHTPLNLWNWLVTKGYAAADLHTFAVWDPMDDCPQRDIVAWPVVRGVPWRR